MSLWDPQQREWLEAMGHSLLVLAGEGQAGGELAAGEPVAPDAVEHAAPVAGDERAAARPAPAANRGAEAVEAKPSRSVHARAPAPSMPEPSAPATVPPARPRTDPATKAAALEVARRGAAREADGPLREALLRATGQPPAAAARTLRKLDVDQAALRRDPAAKRALWARLRPLRKASAR